MCPSFFRIRHPSLMFWVWIFIAGAGVPAALRKSCSWRKVSFGSTMFPWSSRKPDSPRPIAGSTRRTISISGISMRNSLFPRIISIRGRWGKIFWESCGTPWPVRTTPPGPTSWPSSIVSESFWRRNRDTRSRETIKAIRHGTGLHSGNAVLEPRSSHRFLTNSPQFNRINSLYLSLSRTSPSIKEKSFEQIRVAILMGIYIMNTERTLSYYAQNPQVPCTLFPPLLSFNR